MPPTVSQIRHPFWSKTDRIAPGREDCTPNTISTQYTMATLAALISSAIEKVSTDPTYVEMEFATREEARIDFTNALLFELGLGPKPVAAHAPVEVPTETKAPKKRAPKKSKEAVVAEAALAVVEQIKEAPKEVEVLAEQLGQLALDEQPKPKKAKKAPVPEPVANAGAGAEPVKEKKKPGPKPKTKSEGPVNVEKLTPTMKKHLKTIAEELKVDPREKEFLTYANGLSAEEWAAQPLDNHIRDFLTPDAAPLSPPPDEFLLVEFKGKDYLVDPDTKYVYTNVSGPLNRERDRIGIVGSNDFADMEI